VASRIPIVIDGGQIERLQSADVLVRPTAGDSYVAYFEFLLDNEPTAETGATDAAYTNTFSGLTITSETWKRNDATNIKTIDYTYTGNKLTTEVRKVFALDGTTIEAQVTWTYVYTGNFLTSASMVRNV
jgi:hypothetical protein